MSASRPLALIAAFACFSGCQCGSTRWGRTSCTQDSDCGSGLCSNGFCQPTGEAPDASVNPDASDPGDASSAQCLPTASPCTPGQALACCSGVCTPQDGGATACGNPVICSLQGAPCSNPTDCCSMECAGGTCGSSTCQQIGGECSL